MAYTKYSLTPANNTAAPPDGAPEGMLPSAVNDTMRDMMAQIRDVGDGVRDGTYTMTAPKITGGTITGAAITSSTGSFTTLATSSTTTFTGLTASTALALDASKNVVSVTNTGTGNNVLSASPTLTGTIAGASLSLSSLTSGRVTYAGASGLLTDSANLKFDGNNLGIGTTPAYDLQVSKTVSSGSVITQINNPSATGSARLYLGNDAGESSAYFQVFGSSHAAKPSIINIGGNANYPLVFDTNGTEKVRITAAGNVGIGTSSPQRTLSIANGGPVVEIDPNGGTAGPIYFNYNRLTTTYTTPEYFALAHDWRVSGGGSGMVLNSSGNLGLGVTPSAWNVTPAIEVGALGNGLMSGGLSDFWMTSNAYYNSGWKYAGTNLASSYNQTAGKHIWFNATSGTAGNAITFTQAMTLDNSGNLLVGTTTSPSGSGNLAVGQGQWAANTGYFQLVPKYTGSTGSYYFYDNSTGFFPAPDNTQALGNSSYRWTTVYATTALINTSDVNTKQQIRDLSAAEKAVAQFIKGLIKAYKFNDSVVEKGDGARIHIGVIAQDVQSAFVAQGLDSSKYAMFCSDTWYEVNGKAHSEKDGFYTKDSPNAVEVTRLGIRYDELLAFVISTL